MKIIIETPKYSFVKYAGTGGKYVKAMTSPFPTLFNYGFIEETVGEDRMPKDCIVLGGSLKQGDKLDIPPLGVVNFIDDGKEDNKTIFSPDGRISLLDKLKIHAFFIAYAIFKVIRYLAKERRLAECSYKGFSLL